MEEKMFAVWRIIDKYNDVISFGIDEHPYEFDLDRLPEGWCGDRPIQDVQKAMKNNPKWKEEGYRFEYEIYNITSHLTIINQNGKILCGE